MEKSNNKAILFTVIAVVVMVVTVGAFTFAFFTADTTNTNGIQVNANVSNAINPVFTATAAENLNLEVTTADMLESGAGTYKEASKNIVVTLLGGATGAAATCTFNFVWTNTGATYTPSPNAGTTPEYTLKIEENNTTVMAETKVNSLTSGGTIVSNQSISSTGTLTTKTYTVTARIYNLDVEQNIYNKTYSSKISVSGVTC